MFVSDFHISEFSLITFTFCFRMGLEFYMTRGKYLKIGLLVCEHCRIKSLKVRTLFFHSTILLLLHFKGTVSVILSDPPCKVGSV